MTRLGLGARLTLWHGAAVTLILVVATLAADRALVRALDAQVDAALVAVAEAEATLAIEQEEDEIELRKPGRVPVALGRVVQVVDAGGRVVRRRGLPAGVELPAPAALLARLAGGRPVFETLPDLGAEPLRVVSLPVVAGGRLHYAVQVGTSLAPARAFLHTARLLFAAAAAAILVAVVLSGALLARRALRPIDRVVAMARRIGEANLAARLPHPGVEDEVGRLVGTLNEMLDRIERAFEAQRRFTADASHEFRSPLARLRTELEVTLRRPRAPAEYERALRSSLEEVERLSRLTGALLTLARLDAGLPHDPSAEPADVAAVATGEIRRVEPEAARKGVALVLDPPPAVRVRASPGAVAVVLGNLLDNAVRFSPAGGRVAVRIAEEEGSARVDVADRGPGIRPEATARVFDRFYRADPSRAPGAPGVGLGLSIARALVEAYGGRIDVSSPPSGGATFTVTLPLAA